eukprot:m.47616 g.47616  ORF g.47616 m.47616 type:complete len:234 (+) comp7345_c0_seq1:47-748(+)
MYKFHTKGVKMCKRQWLKGVVSLSSTSTICGIVGLKTESKSITKGIRKELSSKIIHLYKLVTEVITPNYDSEMQAQMHSSLLIENEVKEIETLQRVIDTQEDVCFSKVCQFLKTEIIILRTLQAMVIETKLGCATHRDVHIKWLIMKSRDIRYELRLLVQKLLRQTYPFSILELQHESLRHLQAIYTLAVSEHNDQTKKLSQKSFLPKEFHMLVNEYEHICAEIDSLSSSSHK